MKKQFYIGAGIIVVIIFLLYYLLGSESTSKETIMVQVKSGEFKIYVTTTGELEAKSSEKIFGPSGLRNVRIWNLKIEDIVAEGTVVDSGQYVASLDRTELSNRMKDQEIELEQLETQYTKTKLDTTLELRNARDDLINLEYAMEETKITLEQSAFEPPATIRQVKIDLEKSERTYNQAVKNYKLRLEKAKANMQEVSASLNKAKRKYDDMLDVLKQFTVKAPKAGMVIYKRGWDGKKISAGAQISTWDNIVATLPNLTEMISKTFVNEIDISKVKEKQDVEIGIDAFPDKKFTGKVIEVANIGEQLRNSNAKVFEVKIEVNEYDSILRPAMTTKNTIITGIIDSVLYIPLECVHSNDSLSYVYTSNRKQHIIVGKSNENEIIVKAGLEEDDKIYLIPPENAEDYRLDALEPEIIEKYSKPKANSIQTKKDSLIGKDTATGENKDFQKPH